jgi:membrane protein YqaA with SNARE-associated domain
VRDVLSVLVIAFASALVPVINIEAYLSVRAAVADVDAVWFLGFVAAVGQMVGKLIWYRVGAASLDWRWVRKKIDSPKAQARLERWRTRTEERPVLAGTCVLASAAAGLPPFAVISVVAGQLRMNVVLFLVLGLIGRWLRFAGLLGGVGWLGELGLL